VRLPYGALPDAIACVYKMLLRDLLCNRVLFRQLAILTNSSSQTPIIAYASCFCLVSRADCVELNGPPAEPLRSGLLRCVVHRKHLAWPSCSGIVAQTDFAEEGEPCVRPAPEPPDQAAHRRPLGFEVAPEGIPDDEALFGRGADMDSSVTRLPGNPAGFGGA
jgi:hypothetical protein